ncbi:MAG: LTA synthase family protein [Sphingobacteriaceae bacterium]
MLKHFETLIRFYCFWLIFFFLDRLLFVLYYAQKFNGLALGEQIGPFYHGLRLDFSMAGYISLLPLLFYIFLWFFPKIPFSTIFLKAYTYLLLGLFSFGSIANMLVYKEWGTKLNFRALEFALDSPGETIASSLSSPIALAGLLFVLLLGSSLAIAHYFLRFNMPNSNQVALKKGISAFGLITITFLLIRGGWQLTPVNQSMSYFSPTPIVNHASVNTFWNLMHDISKNIKGQENPYHYLPEHTAKELVEELYRIDKSGNTAILSTSKPNVVLIIMESFTADLVKGLGGLANTAPELEKLSKGGLSFSNIYASGDRTDKGIIAILSGFPSQAIRSVIKEESKQEKLPALSQTFKNRGYATSFYYGGETEFFGMKSFVLFHQFDQVTGKEAFQSEDMNSKWGAYDEKVYEKQLADLKNTEEPFFSTLLTLTNHEPFELPGNAKFPGTDVKEKFKSTAFYADSCLGAYIAQAQKQPWYKNTLFIVVADHGHRLPLDKYENWHPNRYRIPLVFFGDVLKPKFRGTIISKYGGQTDIARTLCTQVQANASPYVWSKDLLNKNSKEFGFYDWDNGFGIATPSQTISFDNVGKTITYQKDAGKTEETKRLEKVGKAYLQEVYANYLAF